MDGASSYRGVFAKVVNVVDLSKGYWNLKRKMWVTMHFSEIIKQL